MGLDQVIAEVRRDGDGRAQKVLGEARQEAERIVTEARQRAEQWKRDRTAQAEKDADALRARLLSSAEFEARKVVLSGETELREELRSRLLAAFGDLPAKTRQAHLDALVREAQETIPQPQVWGSAKDEAHLRGRSGVTFAGVLPIAGGLVAESEDQSVRLDLSYETLLSDLWRDVLRAEAGLFQ